MDDTTPFHRGELQLQDRLGVRAEVHSYAPRVIRPYMPDQHRMFFEDLSYFFVGSVDSTGAPWASVLWGAAGFITTPTAEVLQISAVPLDGDPLATNLVAGAELGMVGLTFENRRRNRVNGRVTHIRDNSLTVEVTQSFGNCPQYIQARTGDLCEADTTRQPSVTARDQLSAEDRQLITESDTLFIASVSETPGADARHGADMSHRGGAPGFVRILEDGSLLIPDFSGNRHFNTLGNILETGKAGLLFIDFSAGDLLHLTGTATVVWPEDSPYLYDGAERYVHIMPTTVIRRAAALPFRWIFHEASPYVQADARWHPATVRQTLPYKLIDKVSETDHIASFYLSPADGTIPPEYEPGQHLPIEVTIGGVRHRRTYTLSRAPSDDMLRITIKRELQGTVSRYLHDTAAQGQQFMVRPPAGDFTLQAAGSRAAVFLSAGIGITPMMAMAEARLASQPGAPTYFLHGTRTLAAMPFREQLLAWQKAHRGFLLHVAESASADSSNSGRLDGATLDALDVPVDADYYLCGPAGFMEALYHALKARGVTDDHIHFEAFGPSTLKRETANRPSFGNAVDVTFRKSRKTVSWQPDKESLLDVAENAGIDAPYSCRSGNCGSCAVALIAGQLDQSSATFEPAKGEVLTCCALPASDTGAPVEIDL